MLACGGVPSRTDLLDRSADGEFIELKNAKEIKSAFWAVSWDLVAAIPLRISLVLPEPFRWVYNRINEAIFFGLRVQKPGSQVRLGGLRTHNSRVVWNHAQTAVRPA